MIKTRISLELALANFLRKKMGRVSPPRWGLVLVGLSHREERLGCGVGHGLEGDVLLVLDTLDQSQLLSYTHDRNGLLRGSDLGEAQPDDALGSQTLGGQLLGNLDGKALIEQTGLGNDRLAGLDQLLVHLLENLVDLGQVVGALDGDGDGLCAGGGVLAHLVPPSTSWGWPYCLFPSDDYYYTLMPYSLQ